MVRPILELQNWSAYDPQLGSQVIKNVDLQ